MEHNFPLKRLRSRRLFLATLAGAAVWRPRLLQGGRHEMSKAEAEIDKFRRGERYQPPPRTFLVQGVEREKDLAPFGPALREESAYVREQIVALLADLGKRVDRLFPAGGELVREPTIISILIANGLTKNDLGREASLLCLQQLVPVAFLKPYEKSLTDDFQAHPSSTAFLLMAKLKPASMILLVRKLFALPRWSKELEARVAAAALGDHTIEKEYIERFVSTSVPEEKARLARILGLIGTEVSLRTLAAGLRTDLVIDKMMAFKRSVRLDVLQALSYNFPEQTIFYENQINDDGDYARAEKFCEERWAIKWDGPRPSYLKISGYPIPLPPQ